jgi:PAS domain S-box-containing protein
LFAGKMNTFSSSNFVFNFHALPPLITAFAILSLGLIVAVREKGSRVSLLYLGYTLAASAWMFCAAMALFMSSEDVALQWMRFANAGVTMMPAALYHFTVVVLEAEKRHRLRIRSAWAVSALFLSITLLTDLLFDGFYHYSWGIFLKFRWPSYLFIVYFLVMTAATLRLYWVEYRKSDRDTTRHRRAQSFLIAFSIGYLGTLDFLPAIGVPYYPLSFIPMVCMLILVSRAIWRYRLVDITPAFAAQEIIATMNDGLIVLDRDGVIRLVNRATSSILGCRERDLIGKRPAGALAAYGELADKLDLITGSDSIRNLEISYQTHEGLLRTLSLSTSTMRNANGERVATVCLVNDISGRKRADEERELLIAQLRDANEKLQSIDKVKTNFITIVSHELRTPLTTIKAFVELLLVKQGMQEGRKVKLMSTINEEADRLSRLITDLLDLARIESGSMKWQVEALSLESLIHNVLVSMTLLFEQKGLRVTTQFDSHLCPIWGDRDRLVQVVTNILSNAVKFSRPGGAIHVALRQEKIPRNEIVVEVADTGIGIPPGDLELIFEKFHRSEDKHAAETEGTGLGLAIAREIVELHGGRIWAASTYGKGSVFTFTLPLASQETGVPQKRTEQPDGVNNSGRATL